MSYRNTKIILFNDVKGKIQHHIDKLQIFTLLYLNDKFGKYDEIVDNVKKFMALKLDTKIVMLWRDNSYIEYVKDLDKNILHCIPHRKDNFMRLLDNIDYDVSNTHWGPKTHYKFSKLLKAKLS